MVNIKKKLEIYMNGNSELREEIFEYYKPYAQSIAVSYYGITKEDEDILSASYEGLIYALNKMNGSHHANTIKLIKRCIISSIRREIKYTLDFRYIGIPRNIVIDTLIKVKQLTEDLGRKLTEVELTRLFNNTPIIGDIIESLNEEYTNYEKLDTVQNGNIDIENLLMYKELSEGLKDLIISSGLSDIEKQVLLHRYYNTRLTLEKIGVKLGYSLSTIREAEYRGIKKLKEYYIEYLINLANAKESSTRIDVRGLTYKKRK